jgi:hypothetical protein
LLFARLDDSYEAALAAAATSLSQRYAMDFRRATERYAALGNAEQVAARIRRGLRHVDAERLIPAPDCGMKYMPRERAFGKLCALTAGAAIVRRELAG